MSNLESKALGWWATPFTVSKTATVIVCIAIFVIGAALGHFGA